MKKLKIQLMFLGMLWMSKVAFVSADGENIQPDNYFPKVKIETNVGNIIVELDRIKTPITTNNFLAYVAAGQYDNTIFHRVIKDFVVQGGGYDILHHPREQRKPIFNESGSGLKNEAYTIAMAREENPHSATNQFYFNMQDNQSLDPGKNWGYSVFGMVIEGTETLDLMAKVLTHTEPKLGWEDFPKKQLLLKKASIIAE